MKYPKEMYLPSNNHIYGGDRDCYVGAYKERIVKCRRKHKCPLCQRIIKAGEQALFESGFMDGESVSCYTCLDCIEEWLEESGQVEVGK